MATGWQQQTLLLLLVAVLHLVGLVHSECTTVLGPWREAAAIPEIALQSASAVVGKKLFVIAGFNTNALIPTPRMHIYDIENNEWESKDLHPSLRGSHAQACQLDGRIYVGPGFAGPNPGPATTTVYIFDTSSGSWAVGPSLPSPRASGAVVCDEKRKRLHYIGGLVSRDTDTDNHVVIDLSVERPMWTSAAALPPARARNHFQGIIVNDVIYLSGGQNRHDTNPIDLPITDGFDLTANTWLEPRANLTEARSHAEPATVNMNGRVVVIGGRNNRRAQGQSLIHKSIEEYDPETDTWRVIGSIPEQRQAPVAGFFKNVRQGSVVGDFLVVTAGGFDFDQARNVTWVASVTRVNCSEEAPQSPPLCGCAPEAVPVSPAPEPQSPPLPQQQQPIAGTTEPPTSTSASATQRHESHIPSWMAMATIIIGLTTVGRYCT
jgi:N-acetylneuraminic acid mutarotase